MWVVRKTIRVKVLLQFKVDSDDTQTLVTAEGRRGLWKVNEFIGTILLEFENIFSIFYITITTSVKIVRFG